MILIHLNKILDVNKLDKERSVYFYVFKKIAIIFSLCLLICNIALAKTLPNPDTSAVSACLIDADDNGVLYGKDEDKIMHPASTTK